jgi:hypothetical protein
MAKKVNKQHLDNKQQAKRRNSPTWASIREGLAKKYPIGYSKKPKEG